MTFAILPVLVAGVLAYAFDRLAALYGARLLSKLAFVTVAYFFAKEWLQGRHLLVPHFYGVSHAFVVEILGVPAFVVLGHLFVVVVTWQLAVMTMHRVGLTRYPGAFVTLVFYDTAAFAMLMENTGIVGHWWVWQMPWFFPEFFHAPLRDLPLEWVVTEVWGYFMSTYWCVLLLTGLPGPWTARRVGVLVLGLAAALYASRSAPAIWMILTELLPFALVLLAPTPDGPAWRRLFFPAETPLFQAPGSKQRRAVLIGLAAMCGVAVAQLVARNKWVELVSLFPVCMFAAGAFGRWPTWVDCLVSLGLLLAGYVMHSGNFMLAAWLVLRCSATLVVLPFVIRWRETARHAPAGALPLAAPAETSPAVMRSP
jgi:hypothetical protein